MMLDLHQSRDENALEGAVSRALQVILGLPASWSLWIVDRSRLVAFPWRSTVPALRERTLELDGGPVAAALTGAPAFRAVQAESHVLGNVASEVGACLPLDFRSQTYAALVLHQGVAASVWPDVQLLARHLGVALANLQRAAGVLASHDDLRTRLEALGRATSLMSVLELEPLLVKLLEMALDVARADVGCLFHSVDGLLEPAAEWGLPSALVGSLERTAGDGLLDALVAAGETFVSQNLQQDERLRDAHKLPPSGLVAVPIRGRERPGGCLVVGYARDGVPMSRVSGLQALANVAGVAMEAVQAQQLRQEHARASELLDIAAQQQEQLLARPSIELAGVSVAVRAESCEEAGGDVHLTLVRPDGTLLVAVGDVVGHGVAATLQMASLLAALRALAPVVHAPDRLLEYLQAPMQPALGEDRFLTLFVAVVDPKRGVVSYASAGHDPAWLLAPDGSAHSLEATGLPLGVLDEAEYGVCTLPMEPGAVLTIGTDGLWEAVGHTGQVLGTDDLLKRVAVGVPAQEVVETLWGHVEGHLAGRKATDDRTLVVLRREPACAITADPKELVWLRRQVSASLLQAGWALDEVEENLLLIALTEAVANVQEHGMTGPLAEVEFAADPERMRLRLSYPGEVFEPPRGPVETDMLSEGGRGLPLITAGVDEVRYFSPGPGRAGVELIKRRPPAAAR